MVRLDRVYTKSGDKGKTSLGTGQRLLKCHPRIQAIGDVDEVNSFLGLALHFSTDVVMKDLLQKIQNDLFDVGADLCVPDTKKIEITADYVTRLERAIDEYNQHLKPLTSFVLPGGSSLSTYLHLVRTVCRRAERSITALAVEDIVNPHLLCYINRLSDLFFVLARFANEGQDLLWEPQKWKTT
jgi:cob(I)alamin adenosyltransferase